MFLVILRLIRIQQWTKNLLVFVPLVTAHAYSSIESIWLAVGCFVTFCCVASASYVLNDIVDRDHDRLHPEKKHRPLAAGSLGVGAAIFLIVMLIGFSLIALLQMPKEVLFAVLFYFVISSAYSFWLKKVLLVDVFILAMLYTTRVLAGALAISVPLSFWLLAFSVFLFLSLAFLKRFVELDQFDQEKEALPGRGYINADREVVQSLGIASGYVAGLVFALFINNQISDSIYSNPWILWVSCVVILFWINRLWMIAARGTLGGDPVLFASKDYVSLVCAVIVASAFWLAL